MDDVETPMWWFWSMIHPRFFVHFFVLSPRISICDKMMEGDEGLVIVDGWEIRSLDRLDGWHNGRCHHLDFLSLFSGSPQNLSSRTYHPQNNLSSSTMRDLRSQHRHHGDPTSRRLPRRFLSFFWLLTKFIIVTPLTIHKNNNDYNNQVTKFRSV